MVSQNLLVLLLLCVMAAAASAGNTYAAGGTAGWELGVNIGPLSVYQGDEVEFSYEPGEHDVNMVSESAYYSCDSSAPYATYSSGEDQVSFPSQGAFYFICSKAGHCKAGMKIAVYVQ